jgi:hypothetical protein
MNERPDNSMDTWRRLWSVALFYAVVTFVLSYPLPLQMASSVPSDDPDTHLFLWAVGWDVHAFAAQPLSIFDANIYYPQRLTLAYGENLIGSALLAAPIVWLTGNLVLAFNLVTLLSCVLCGLGAYVLARRLGLSTPSAILCGLVFAFSPTRFFRLTQLFLATVQWVPFMLAYLHSYLDRGRPRDARLAIAFFSLQALTSGHGAVFATLAAAVLLVLRFASGDSLDLLRRVRHVGFPGLLLFLPGVLVFDPYLSVQRELGLRRSLENFDPVPVSFLASPTSLHSSILSLFPDARINETANGFLFPGYVPLLFAAAALVPIRGRWTRTLACYALLTVICVWLSAGTPFGLWSWVNGLPGLSLVRVPSRFMILAVLGLAVLSALGFERMSQGLSAGRQRMLAVVASALLIVECAGIPLQLAPFRIDPPAIDRWLDGQPKPFSIAEIPVGIKSRFYTTYMLHATAHWQKTIHGYSGVQAALHDRLYEELKYFPDERSMKSLADLGVTYVVVHADLFDPRHWADVERALPNFRAWLTLVHEEGAGRIYALQAPGADQSKP